MLKKIILMLWVLMLMILSHLLQADAPGFKVDRIGSRIYMLTDMQDNARQLAVVAKKGVVIINTFWSEITANRFKEEWIRVLKRRDFLYVVNTVDRLDLFGGNGAYRQATIIGHASFLKKFNQKAVDEEIKRLIEMWREKAEISRKRLSRQKPGSQKEQAEKKWLNTCIRRADEMEKGFALVLPQKVYKDRMTLNLGDTTLQLVYFGRAHYEGMTLVVVPEEKAVIVPGFIFHPQHLAPYPYPNYIKLDVPRWISVLEDILEGERAVEQVVVRADWAWSTERALTHLHYIKKLWNRVKELESEGKDLREIQDLCSMDKDFAFVKDMPVYKDHGDRWVRMQHRAHVSSYFLQHKNLATEMIKKEAKNSSFREAVEKVLKIRAMKSDLYFGESDINGFGYYLMAHKRLDDAIEIFKLNVTVHPKSANVYDSLAFGYMRKGDTKLAIKNYQKSLQINPKNENAKRMLKKLEK